MHIWLECDTKTDLITGHPGESSTEKISTGGGTLQMMAGQITTSKVPTTAKFTMEQTKDAYRLQATTQIAMNRSAFISHNEFFIRTPKIDVCIQKAVLVAI